MKVKILEQIYVPSVWNCILKQLVIKNRFEKFHLRFAMPVSTFLARSFGR